MTAAASSNGRSSGDAGCNRPSFTMAMSSSRSSALRSRFPMAQAPQSMPTTVRLCSSTWLSATDEMGPDANPMTHNRPNDRSARRAGSLWRPPTGSTTTSTPPSVSSRTRVLRSSSS